MKKIAEDVLAGKLKGCFILRNGDWIPSENLSKIIDAKTYPYFLTLNNGFSISITRYGEYFYIDKTTELDIVDFIKDVSVHGQKEVIIETPKDYLLDVKKSTPEKIVLKKKNFGPESLGEYIKSCYGDVGYYIDCASDISICEYYSRPDENQYFKNLLPSKKLAEAFLAMMQLMSLRQAWIGDWKPNFSEPAEWKWAIVYIFDRPSIQVVTTSNSTLSFPSKEMAVEFLDCFKDLIEQAKTLI